jgi:hypothetical protein
MMYQSQDRLECQKHEHDDADDGVVMIKQVHGDVLYEPYANAKSSNINEVGEDLKEAVDYPEIAGGTKADEDRTDWEEQNEGEGSEDAVCDQDLLSLRQKGLHVEAAAAAEGTIGVVAA